MFENSSSVSITITNKASLPFNAVEQIIGCEGETASLYERRSLNLKLRVIGFAPRQFNR